MESSTIESVLHEALGKSFIAALLITGSVDLAEAAVMESISLLDVEERCAQALLRGAIKASIRTGNDTGEQRRDELESALAILPFELQSVLHLTPELRRCFVCRLLVDLPLDVCASMLHLEALQIDECTCVSIENWRVTHGKKLRRKNARRACLTCLTMVELPA
jgi:hypothetical protein